MGILAVGEKLKGINPHFGCNPSGNCKDCARETARVLISGREPHPILDTGTAKVTDRDDETAVKSFEIADDRSQQVLDYLRHAAAGDVYAVDANNHAYNFFKDYDGKIYVIDSNQWFFREITGLDDFASEVRNETAKEVLPYNYADPPKGPQKKEKVIELYFKGKLTENWQSALRSSDDVIASRPRRNSLILKKQEPASPAHTRRHSMSGSSF